MYRQLHDPKALPPGYSPTFCPVAKYLCLILTVLFQLNGLYIVEWVWKMIMNGEKVRTWNKVAVAYVKVIYQHFPGRTEETRETLTMISFKLSRFESFCLPPGHKSGCKITSP
jgi:hypothetical protein